MIGIIAPYGRNETTAAACRLADLVTSTGTPLKFIGCAPNEHKVHPYWDRRVISCRNDGIYKATRGCKCVVHFDLNPQWVDQVSLVSEQARQVLVMPWSVTRTDDVRYFNNYAKVICPCKTQYDHILARYFGSKELNPEKLTWCRWDSGLPQVHRDGLVVVGATRALFLCDTSCIDFAGGMTLQMIDDLLSMNSRLEITVLACKSWSRPDRYRLGTLLRDYTPRFKYIRGGDHTQRLAAFHDHDWVVFPGLRSDFAMYAAQALACGVPCVVYDVECFTERIVDGHNGVVIGCAARNMLPKGPLAVPTAGMFLAGCSAAFADNRVLLKIQEREWSLESQTHAFNNAMANSLEL